MLTSTNIVTVNVHQSWEHMRDIIVCSQNQWTFPSKSKLYVIFTKEHKQFHRVDDIYRYKKQTFQITNGVLVLNDGTEVLLPVRTSISNLERLILGLGLPISTTDINLEVDITQIDFRKVLHYLTSMALKDLGIVGDGFTHIKQVKYGEVVFEAYLKVVSGSGMVPAKDRYMRWLYEQDTLKLRARMFDNSNASYQAGVCSMKYSPTQLADSIFKKLFMLLKSVEFKEHSIVMESLDFVVTITQLEQMRLRDVMLLLGDCIGYRKGFIIRPKLTDIQDSRVYSIFTSISSDTRNKLGFNNYDIGSALQTICLQLVDDASKYPLHQELVDDKTRFRSKVMVATGQDLLWVKKELSKINNLKEEMPVKYKRYPLLEKYFNEAMMLRKEILTTAESSLLENANHHAKPKWEKIWVKGKNEPEFIQNGKKDSSVFFFVWTQWERQIRECMMRCFDNQEACHQVHDAVYSTQIIESRIIEQKVLEETGFRVYISTD